MYTNQMNIASLINLMTNSSSMTDDEQISLDPDMIYGLTKVFSQYKGFTYVIVQRSIFTCKYLTWYIGIPTSLIDSVTDIVHKDVNKRGNPTGKKMCDMTIEYYNRLRPNFIINTPSQWCIVNEISHWIGFDSITTNIHQCNPDDYSCYIKACEKVIDTLTNDNNLKQKE